MPIRQPIACSLLALLGGVSPIAAQGAADFTGTWQLLTIERRAADGTWTPARFAGAAPVGVIMYDALGNMAVQIATDPRLTTMPEGQSVEWTNGYIAYYATYHVNEAGGFVTHYRRDHVNPDVGTMPVVRYFDFSGDTLTLTVAPARTVRLRWLRLRQQLTRGPAERFVVPIWEEPRHRPVFATPELRVLDVGFNPGDTTLFHRHDAPIAYVRIGPSRTNEQVLGSEWGSVDHATPLAAVGAIRIDESYPSTPLEHRVTNVDASPFRLIAVINRGPGQAVGSAGPLGTAGAPESTGRWFRTAHHRIAAGDTWQWTSQPRPVVMVQVSPGSLRVELGTGDVRTLRAPGDFIVLPAGTPATFRGDGAAAVALAIVEVR